MAGLKAAEFVSANRPRCQFLCSDEGFSMSAHDHEEWITVLVPFTELLKYAPALNGMTGEQGSYVMEFIRYEEVSRDLVARIIGPHKADRHAVAVH